MYLFLKVLIWTIKLCSIIENNKQEIQCVVEFIYSLFKTYNSGFQLDEILLCIYKVYKLIKMLKKRKNKKS